MFGANAQLRATAMSGSEQRLAEEVASEDFLRRVQGNWSAEDQNLLENRLLVDKSYAEAWLRIREAWMDLERYAEAPEIMAYRAEAILYVRRAGAFRRLRVTSYVPLRSPTVIAIAALLTILIGVWQLSSYSYRRDQYITGIGEQRTVLLPDHSRIALDAATRIEVRYSSDTRSVALLSGQAQFFVAKDPARPFKVQAGDRIVVAVGTVFTVEYMDRQMHVAMMEGKVAVVDEPVGVSISPKQGGATAERANAAVTADRGASTIELGAGEELLVRADGRSVVTVKADIEAALAWREGKVIFRSEPLGEAARRLNRYSRLQVNIVGESLAATRISGVFEAGDTTGFLQALQRYLPKVSFESPDSNTVLLRER
jgi:transmembrane sensor